MWTCASTIIAAPRRRGRLQLAGVHRHRQHAVVADRPRELDEAVIAEPNPQRLEHRVADPMLAHELAREVHDLRVFGRDAARVLLADGRDGRLGHTEPPGATRLGAHTYTASSSRATVMAASARNPHVERAFEADEGAQVREAAAQLRAVEEHRERPLQRAAALDDAVNDGVILRSDLLLAGDGWQPCHVWSP